jgi:RNA polymerase primary sigma factor
MKIHDPLKSDVTWQALLNSREATVLSAGEERDLLIELVGCRERILDAFGEPVDTDWETSREQTDFQQRVRELASSPAKFDPDTAPLRALARRYTEIRTKLVMANVRLVAHVAKRFYGRGIPPADLIQEGVCALLLAIDRFDVEKPTRLATYAIWWIRQGIQRAVATSAYPVRLNPRHLRLLARNQNAIADGEWDAPALANRPRSAGSLTIERLLAATLPSLSLDAPSRHDDTSAVVDFFMMPEDQDPDESDVTESVVEMLKALAPREQVVLKLRFGLSGEPRQTLIQVSHVLGVSKERVRQIQESAMRKLRLSLDTREFAGARRQQPA